MKTSTKISIDHDTLKEIVREVIAEAKIPSTDTLAKFKDEIIHEIKGLQEEVTLVIGYKDEIEDHDFRIQKLEKHAGLAATA